MGIYVTLESVLTSEPGNNFIAGSPHWRPCLFQLQGEGRESQLIGKKPSYLTPKIISQIKENKKETNPHPTPRLCSIQTL